MIGHVARLGTPHLRKHHVLFLFLDAFGYTRIEDHDPDIEQCLRRHFCSSRLQIDFVILDRARDRTTLQQQAQSCRGGRNKTQPDCHRNVNLFDPRMPAVFIPQFFCRLRIAFLHCYSGLPNLSADDIITAAIDRNIIRQFDSCLAVAARILADTTAWRARFANAACSALRTGTRLTTRTLCRITARHTCTGLTHCTLLPCTTGTFHRVAFEIGDATRPVGHRISITLLALPRRFCRTASGSGDDFAFAFHCAIEIAE